MTKPSKFWYAKHFGYPLYEGKTIRIQWLINLCWGFHIGKPKGHANTKWEIHIGPFYMAKFERSDSNA